MSAGPWKSEPAPHRARATIITNGNAERRYRHPHVAREAFDRLTLEGGGLRRSLRPPAGSMADDGHEGSSVMAGLASVDCSACGRAVPGVSRTTGRCDDCATVNAPRRPWTVNPWASFSVDASARRFVDERPDGADLRDIGAALGISHQRVAQLERRALQRISKRLRLAGVQAEDALAYLMRDERSRAMGGGMHLALVHPVRESSVRELAPVAPWSVSSLASRTSPVVRVELAFGAELGQRLDVALREAERLVEVIELAVPSLRVHVARAMRAPALELVEQLDVARPRPVHEPEAFTAELAPPPWLSFTGSPIDPAPSGTPTVLRVPRRSPRLPKEVPVLPVPELPPPVTKTRKPRALPLDRRIRDALLAAGIKATVIPCGRTAFSVLVVGDDGGGGS